MGNKQEKYVYVRNEPKNEKRVVLEPYYGTNRNELAAYSGCGKKITIPREFAGVF